MRLANVVSTASYDKSLNCLWFSSFELSNKLSLNVILSLSIQNSSKQKLWLLTESDLKLSLIRIKMEPRQGRASQEQQMALLEFMENHGDLAKPQPGPQGRLLSNQLWTDLTELLNSMGGGVLKSTEKWKKVWADWKTKTKKKAILIKRHTSGTGGGPSNGLTLTAPEERLIAIMGVNAVEGQPNISELGFNRRPVNPSHANLVHREDASSIIIQAEVNDPQQPELPEQSAELPQHPAELPEQPAELPQQPAELPQQPRERHAAPRRQRHRELESPHSSSPTTPQRRTRRRRETPFERACMEFTKIERRRLQMEQEREKMHHEREMERIQVAVRTNELLNSLLQVNQNILNVLGV
ncbi:uncharacterized protein LOC119694130 [Plutella xylostella]|uniref:uncharacterized protein LOC119694130 n=1 Tax=Plutella xylostella TaxID=51655 RepID=UPI0018D07C79|nr:uncharacterized protein LOC119694130 [Plutella xylostella]